MSKIGDKIEDAMWGGIDFLISDVPSMVKGVKDETTKGVNYLVNLTTGQQKLIEDYNESKKNLIGEIEKLREKEVKTEEEHNQLDSMIKLYHKVNETGEKYVSSGSYIYDQLYGQQKVATKFDAEKPFQKDTIKEKITEINEIIK